MPGIPSKDASFVWGTPRNYALTLFWVFADYIGNTPGRIIVKIVILSLFIMLELCIWINATLPWMERKTETLSSIRKIED